MTNENITIQEAAELSGKSVQTIRRAIKAGKIKYRRKKTPQGFNYLISKASVCDTYNVKLEEKEEVVEKKKEIPKAKKKTAVVAEGNKTVSEEDKAEKSEADGAYITAEDFSNFAKTLDKLISQHADERQNFLRLVNTLQEKIFVLENQMNLLKSPEKKWFHFWK